MKRKQTDEPGDDWVGLGSLNKLLEHRARLGICVLLSRYDALSFRRLRELLEETDGNLGAHLRKLEDARYISVRKEFVERKPVSWYRLEPGGRKALRSHVDALTHLIGQAKPKGRTGP